MIKSIVGFGDSWIYGNEIGSDEPGDPVRLSNCILGQVGNNLNLPTNNLGRPGSSLTSMLWQFAHWVKEVTNPAEHLVLVGLTYDSRESWWPVDQSSRLSTNKGPVYVELHQKITQSHRDDWSDFVKHFLQHASHDQVDAMRYWQTVNFLDSYCYKHRIPLLQINVAQPTERIMVDSLYKFGTCMVDLLQKEAAQSKIDLHAPGRHPNATGAKFLADRITEEIYNRGLVNG